MSLVRLQNCFMVVDSVGRELFTGTLSECRDWMDLQQNVE